MSIDLEPALRVLAADGIGLALIAMDGNVVHLRMSIEDADCAECVLPRHLLEPVVLDLLRASRPELEGVHIVDPREAADP